MSRIYEAQYFEKCVYIEVRTKMEDTGCTLLLLGGQDKHKSQLSIFPFKKCEKLVGKFSSRGGPVPVVTGLGRVAYHLFKPWQKKNITYKQNPHLNLT